MGASFADKAKQLKPIANFKISLKAIKSGKVSQSLRRKINQAHAVLFGYKDKEGEYHSGYANGPVYPMRFRSSKERAIAQQLAGQTDNRFSNVVFVETVQGKSGKLLKPKLTRNRKGQYGFEVNRVRLSFEPFNKRALVKDPDKEIDRALANHPNAKGWAIKCGKHRTAHKESRRSVKSKVIRYMNQYNNWGKWLNGLVPIEFTKQHSFKEYKKNRNKLKALKSKTETAKRRSNTHGKRTTKTRSN